MENWIVEAALVVGVLLLVDKRLRFRKSGACTSKDAQVAASFVEDVLLMTFYAPPDRSKNCQQQACEHLQEVLLSERVPPCWLAVGDSNEVPTDSYIDQTLQSFRGVLQQQNSPSRWAGSAELDWIHTSCPERLSKLQFVDLHFSDHKVLECFVNIPRKNLTSGLLHPTPSWQKPEQATSTWWRDLLQQLRVQQVSSQFAPLEQPDMDESWQQFVKALAVPSRKLTGWAMLRISNWPAPYVTMDTKERYPNGKSVPPRAEPRGPGSMQQRKLRRRVAQLYELRRHLQRPQRSQFQTSEANRLLQRLHLHGPLDQSGLLSTVLSELEQAKTTLLSTQKEARTTTLRAWAARMNEDPKAPGRWLQSREKVPVRAVQGRVLCENPRDITNEIFQFWTQFWTQNQTVDVSEICDRLQRSAHQPAVHLDWAPPDLSVS